MEIAFSNWHVLELDCFNICIGERKTKIFFVYDFKIEIQFLYNNLYEWFTKWGLKSRPFYSS